MHGSIMVDGESLVQEYLRYHENVLAPVFLMTFFKALIDVSKIPLF